MFQVGVNDVKKSTVKKARRSRKVLQPRHNRNVPASSTTSFPSGKGDSLAAEDYDAASVGDELNTSFMSIDESYSDTEKENRSSKSSRKKHKSSVKVGNKSERRRRSGSSSTSSSSSKRQQKRRRVASISTPDKLNTSLFDEEAQTGGDDVDVGDLNLDSSQKKRDRKREREMAREKNVELAKSYKELGNEMYTRNEYARAVEAYSEALKLDSKNPIYLGNRAAAYFMEGKYFHCIADCDAALHADPSYLRARVRLARTLVVVGEVFSVQEHLKIIAGFHGKNSVAFHEEGRQIERLCLDYERAVSECDTFLRTEQVKKCQDLALSALHMCPGSKRLHILLLAVKLMEAAISSVSPSTSSQQESKESVAEVKRELERMMKACEFEAERNQMAVYLYLYGKLLLLCALTSEARLLLSGAQQLAPQEQRIQNKVALVCKMEACLNAGITAVSQRKFEEAIEHFDHALQLDPNNIAFNARMHFRKASANMSLCKFNAAINDCNQTLRLLPDYHKARIRKAHAHMQLGNYSLAVEELQTAYNINPSTSVARELQAARSVLERAERKAREQKEQRESKQQQQQQQQKQDRPKPSASFKSSSSKPSTPFQYRTRSARKTPKADKKRKSIEMVTCSDHYQVLGVPRRASIGTIKKAFRKKALRYHPDKNMSPNADAKFKRINEAYNTLKSPGKRRTYDLSSGVSSSFF